MNRKHLIIILLIGQLLFQYCTTEEEAVDNEKLKWKYFTKTNGLSDNYISAIYEDKDGNMWFGYSGYGISKYDGKNFTKINTTNGLNDNEVYCFLQQKNGDFLVGNRGGLNLFRNNTWNSVAYLQGVPIRSLFEDAQGTLWIGTAQYGIVYFKNGNFFQILDNACLNCNTVLSIFGHSDGKVWFATNGGVKVYNGSFMTLYTTINGLPSDNISIDHCSNTLYYSTNISNISHYIYKSGKCLILTHYPLYPVLWIDSVGLYHYGFLLYSRPNP